MNIENTLEKEFKLLPWQIDNTIKLIDEGNTIPFIARYRKELTGSIDDQLLRELNDRLLYLRNLDERKKTVQHSIEEQGALTDEIIQSLQKATTLAEVEDIYRPFKPKKRTRAIIAKEKGFEPLALKIYAQDLTADVDTLLSDYADYTKEEALAYARDIIAEILSDCPKIRATIRKHTKNNGLLTSKFAKKVAEDSVYSMYYDFAELVKKVADHRILAMNRGEKEDFLSVKIEIEDSTDLIYKHVSKGNPFVDHIIIETIDDSYKRLIGPSIERELRAELKERAEIGAIKVFGENLKQLLMLPPIKGKTVLAIDPGFRTGCKVAVVNDIGKVLDVSVIYPTPPVNKVAEAKKIILNSIDAYNVDIIAIGNGTASRETEQFVAELIKEAGKTVSFVIVNESGASVYSASKLAKDEFPDFDVALRSAVSIGRRLQDPLAELVKIDPKSIGVGQYQHDMNQKILTGALGGVVESCVNNVGVDINTASSSLLSYVSGISASLAKNILEYREEKGKFTSRRQLLDVKKLGPKAFEQSAGFLRINEENMENPLDATAVHPESYDVCKKLLEKLGIKLTDIKNKGLKDISKNVSDSGTLAEELGIGLPTLRDILNELEKPGRDPREDMPPQILRDDVLSMDDLHIGMILKGTVRNVIDFGAFVDIGVHQDGLVHISQMSEKFIKHPLEKVSVGDIIDVKILEVEKAKNRISLTMKI